MLTLGRESHASSGEFGQRKVCTAKVPLSWFLFTILAYLDGEKELMLVAN